MENKEMEKFLQTTPDVGDLMPAAYVCSCGQWYDVAYCGYPMAESICFICRQKIGGLEHKPVDREGHFRIFKHEKQEKSVIERCKGASWFPRKVFRYREKISKSESF